MNHKDKKTFIADGFTYENYLTPEARANLEEAFNEVQYRAIEGDIKEQEILNEVKKISEDREERVIKEEQEYKRTLQRKEQDERRSGFINASIILYFVLVFGVLIATALIFLQK